MGHKPKITPKKDAEYKRLAAEREAAGRPMTDREAEAEARRLWGDDGRAWHPYYAKRGDVRFCCVGLRVGDTLDDWKVYGHGETWEAAFSAAKHNKH